jgi:cytochrome P450
MSVAEDRIEPYKVDFDHHFTPGQDPFAELKELRERCPVAYTEHHGGYWVLTKATDVRQAAQDWRTFSSARSADEPEKLGDIIPKVERPLLVPVELDPPTSLTYKRLFTALLSPEHAEGFRPTVRRWAHRFIDDFIERGECDVAREYASPIPACVTLETLGLPTDNWELVSRATHDRSASVPGSDRHTRALADYEKVRKSVLAAVADRRRAPRGDVISHFVELEVDGRRTTDEELEGLLMLFVDGGVETTSAATSSAVVHLSLHEGDRRRLAEDPALIETAAEEFLRVYPPSMAHARTVVQDTNVRGCPLRVGDRVLLSWASANRDDEVFADADSFVLARSPNRHYSFGIGPHRCAGSHLGRVVFQEMLRTLLARIPDFELAVDPAELQPNPDRANFNTFDAVPLTFKPGTRRGAEADR